MRRNTSGIPAHGAGRFRRLLRRVGVGLGILLALFLVLEVGIRHVPPDGMTVAYESRSSPNGPTRVAYTAPKDQQTINATYAALNESPTYHSFQATYVDSTHLDGCYPSAYPQITFTWHGIPVESWSGYCVVVENSGGLSDVLMFTYHRWAPPSSGPVPPPPAPR